MQTWQSWKLLNILLYIGILIFGGKQGLLLFTMTVDEITSPTDDHIDTYSLVANKILNRFYFIYLSRGKVENYLIDIRIYCINIATLPQSVHVTDSICSHMVVFLRKKG